jgi:hypothetical protein
VIIDSINHEDAARSPYAAAFHAVGFQSDYKSLMLWKRRPA